jgi:hypothetical protein
MNLARSCSASPAIALGSRKLEQNRKRMICAKVPACRPGLEQKFEGVGIRFEHRGGGVPLARRDVRPESISRNLRT